MIKSVFSDIFFSHSIKIAFSFDYYIGIATSNAYQSFDIMKYKKIRDRLIHEKVIKRKQILVPEMVSFEDLALVHTKDYLKSIRDPLKAAQFLRIGPVDPWDSYILEFFRTVTGGTLLAVDHVLKHGGLVFNLGGGFHHAKADRAAGFCLLNDVAVSIEKARLKHGIKKVLIIDLDYHQGDGNLTIYNEDEDIFIFSMHAAKWMESDKKNNLDILVQHDISGEEYMQILKDHLEPIIDTFSPELIIYIAGSDPYEHDTLCDLNLTREDLLERNLYVKNVVNIKKIPMTIVAGGGYGSESWKVYFDFIAASQTGKK